jgi:hypothetical protein
VGGADEGSTVMRGADEGCRRRGWAAGGLTRLHWSRTREAADKARGAADKVAALAAGESCRAGEPERAVALRRWMRVVAGLRRFWGIAAYEVQLFQPDDVFKAGR